MRKFLLLLILLLLFMAEAPAQRITYNFQNVAMPEALRLLESHSRYSINFIYNDLEDFRVTINIKGQTIPNAIRQLIGFYPIEATIVNDSVISVECVEKSALRYKGRVIDASGHPIELANVALLSHSDSSLITGGVTNESGYFAIPCEAKKVIVRISYVGYKMLERMYQTQNIGTVRLSTSLVALKGVKVKAYRPVARITREGFTYSVKNTPLSQSGSLTEVLEQMPMVKKTASGFDVVGKGAATFYLNGRRVYNLSDLDNISAKDLKDVEVITSPGVQYDSSIKSVIKITTNTNALEGLTVNARSTWSQNRHGNWVEQLDIRYNTKRLTIYNNTKYELDKDLTWKDLTQTVYADTLWKETSKDREYRKQGTISNIFGVDYKLSEDNYIGGRYSLTYNFRNDMSLESTNEVLADDAHYDVLKTTGNERGHRRPQHIFNVYYSGKVKGYSINADIDYITSSVVKDNVYAEVSESLENRNIDALSDVKNRLLSMRASIGHKFLGGNATFGMEYRNTKRNDDYTNFGEYIPTSISLLKERQYSPFVDYSILTKAGLFGLGVRMESTKFKYYSDGKYVPQQSQSSTKLFPKFSWGIRIGNLQAQLIYSTSINRPTYRQLSSNILYGSRFIYLTGNPLLRPEYMHDLSLQGVWNFIQFQASYSDARNAIVYWSNQLESQPAVSVMSYKNLPSVKQVRIALVLSRKFGFWNPQMTIAIDKQFLHLSTHTGTVSSNNPICVVKFSNSFKLSQTFTMFLTANYQSPGDYRNVHLTHNICWFGFNATKSFCHDRFCLQLKVNDIFNKFKDGNKVYSDRMTMNLLNTYDFRAVSLTLRYQLHQKDYKRRSHSNIDEELKRL